MTAAAKKGKKEVIVPMADPEYEAETVRRALEGDHEAGREALRLCRAGLDHATLSRPLAAFLAERLSAIDKAIEGAERLRAAKKPSSSIRSDRDAAIAEALLINRRPGKPRDPLPDWQSRYAALGALLLRAGKRPEKVKDAMDDAREQIDGKPLGRAEAGRILAAYKPMLAMSEDDLLHIFLTAHKPMHQMSKGDRDNMKVLSEIVRTYLAQT